MLVLSSLAQEKIVFPTLGTSIHIISVEDGAVRVGVEAPPGVSVHREDLANGRFVGQVTPDASHSPTLEARLRGLTHDMNNRLNSGVIAVALLRRQLLLGQTQQMTVTLDRLASELAALQDGMDRVRGVVTKPPGRSALVVEDNGHERELLASSLRLAGLAVATASDGIGALDYLRHNGRPDVVVLDMTSPGLDGPTTVRAIREDPALAGLKLFGVSGATPERSAVVQGPGGVDRWFPRPLDAAALLEELCRGLSPAD